MNDLTTLLRADDAALASTVAMLTFIGVNVARRVWPTIDGRAVLAVVFGLSLTFTLLLLLYAGVAWSGQTIGRTGLVALISGGLSIISAESYKAQLLNRAQTKAGLK